MSSARRIMASLRKNAMIATAGVILYVANNIGVGALADPLAYASIPRGKPKPRRQLSPLARSVFIDARS
jgi:hypothetical protein